MEGVRQGEGQTYQDGRVVGDIGRRWLFELLVCFDNFDVLHVTSAENDIFELLLGGRDEAAHFAVFGAVGEDVFKCNGRLFRVDFV